MEGSSSSTNANIIIGTNSLILLSFITLLTTSWEDLNQSQSCCLLKEIGKICSVQLYIFSAVFLP